MAWAAGFIDGEGCVTVGEKDGHCQLALKAGNTVKAPLLKPQRLFGGVMMKRIVDRSPKPQWVWQVGGAATKQALNKIHPFLTVKTRQAAIAAVYPVDRSIQGNALKNILQMECRKAIMAANG